MRVGCLVVLAVLAALPAHAATCLSATRALAAGTVPAGGDFATADCGAGHPAPAVRYDAAVQSARLSRPLAAGEVIPGFPSSMMADVVPGQTLYVQVRVGPVVVQREVTALQPASPGQKLFVRAADGTVMSVRYPGVKG
jgi:flagella basal body P-ring formation protein FlgA